MTLPADYTPPTLEQRLDAAGDALLALATGPPPPELNSGSKSDKEEAVWIARIVCRAFAPEHFKDTDTTTGKD